MAQAPNWTEPALTGKLPKRSAMASAYDPVSGRLVAFGGYNSMSYQASTYTFDGSAWTHERTSVSPPARANAGMAFDEATGKVVLFGGYDGGYLNDTWLWDGATHTWSQAAPTTVPTAVTGPNLFPDPVSGHVDQFGGFDGRFYQLRTWRWTGTDWVDLAPTHQPSARAAACVARDDEHGNVLLFAGLAQVNPWNTWVWDGSDWTQQSPTSQPQNRYDGRASFDPQLHGVVVFGGASGGQPLDDAWLWTGAQWTPLAPAQAPSPRESHVQAYLPALGRIVVAGGEDQKTVFTDTWTLDPGTPFTLLGTGIGGSLGAPVLSGAGDLAPGSASGFTLDLGPTTPGNPVALIAGPSAGALPLLGGTFYPAPPLVQILVPADGSGHLSVSAMLSVQTPPNATVVLQAWMLDATAPQGVAASNGLSLFVP